MTLDRQQLEIVAEHVRNALKGPRDKDLHDLGALLINDLLKARGTPKERTPLEATKKFKGNIGEDGLAAAKQKTSNKTSQLRSRLKLQGALRLGREFMVVRVPDRAWRLEIVATPEPSARLNWFWGEHLHYRNDDSFASHHGVSVAVFARCFFTPDHQVFMRDVRVPSHDAIGSAHSDLQDFSQKYRLRLREIPMYVPTLEVSGSFRILASFSRVNVTASGMCITKQADIPPNAIVIGAGTEEQRMPNVGSLRYRKESTGVADLQKKTEGFQDLVDETRELMHVHVLVTRRRHPTAVDAPVTTVLASRSHAANCVIDAMCDGKRLGRIIDLAFHDEPEPHYLKRVSFQLVFRVTLTRATFELNRLELHLPGVKSSASWQEV